MSDALMVGRCSVYATEHTTREEDGGFVPDDVFVVLCTKCAWDISTGELSDFEDSADRVVREIAADVDWANEEDVCESCGRYEEE